MKTIQASLLFTLLFATAAQAAGTYKPVISCEYSGEPTCTVDLITAMRGLTYREIELPLGNKLSVTAAFGRLVKPSSAPVGLIGDGGTAEVELPLNPRLQSNLKIIRFKYQQAKTSPTSWLSSSRWGRGPTCETGNNPNNPLFPAETKERIDRNEVDFSKVYDCDFVVTSVVLALPQGTKAPRDTRPKQDNVIAKGAQLGSVYDAGRSMEELLLATRDNLKYLREVLPTRMKPSAEAYSRSVEDVLGTLNFDPKGAGDPRSATDSEVYEKARSLYVHGSVLEAILNKNKSELTNKYLTGVHNAVVQLAVAFGFNDGGRNLDPTAPDSSKIFGGPLSQGYAALMTAVDLALQDAIMGLPFDPRSAEMRQMYDVQARAQAMRAVVLKADDGSASREIDLLAKAWSDPAYRTALENLAAIKASAGETPSTLGSAYQLLVSAAESLSSFSGLQFPVPFGSTRP